MALQFRRGAEADLPSPTDASIGEPLFTTDSGKLFVKKADGTYAKISGSGSTNIDLSDIDAGSMVKVNPSQDGFVAAAGGDVPSHTHTAEAITSGTLNADRIPTLAQSKVTNLTTDLGNRALSSRTIASGTGMTGGGNLTADRTLAVDFASNGSTSSTQAVRADDSRLSNSRTPTSHTHGNISNDGRIGSVSGLPVVTTASGSLTTLALGAPGQVLKVDPGGAFVEWAADQTGISGSGVDVATDEIWDAKGDLAVATAADTAVRLPVGVNGQVLAVNTSVPTTNLAWKTIAKGDVGLGNVDDTSDASKPVSTATQTALDGKAAASHTHPASQITDFAAAVETRLLVELPNNAGVLDIAQESTLQQLFDRTITTGDGLAGGGDLTANRTLSVDLATNSGLEIDSAKLRAKVKANGGVVRDADGLSVSLPNSSVATASIADAAVTMAKLAQAGATNNQVIKWNGTAWSPADDATTTSAHTHGLTDSYVGEIAAAANQTYTIDRYVAVGRTITDIRIQSTAGTCFAAVKNGANTVATVSVSSISGGSAPLMSNTTVSQNGAITLEISGNSSAVYVSFAIRYTAVTGAIS